MNPEQAPVQELTPEQVAAQKAALAAERAQKKEADKAEKAAAKAAKDAEKKAQKEAEKAAKAAAKEAEKAAKEAAKEATKNALKMPEQNGVRRPKPHTLCGQAWAIFDEVSAKLGSPAPIRDCLVIAEQKGLNTNNVKVEYAQWRKFNGVSGRIVSALATPKVEETKAEPVSTVETNAVEVVDTIGQPAQL